MFYYVENSFNLVNLPHIPVRTAAVIITKTFPRWLAIHSQPANSLPLVYAYDLLQFVIIYIAGFVITLDKLPNLSVLPFPSLYKIMSLGGLL